MNDETSEETGMDEILEEVALLTDDQAHKVLNRVIAGYLARNPEIPVGDPSALADILVKIGADAGESIAGQADDALRDQMAANRQVLVLLVRNAQGREFVQGAIKHSREVLVEPITTALVMAGVIFLLQIEFDVKVTRKDGKASLDIRVGKKPTDKSLIGKILGRFK
jgi:hypothetical protein